MKHRGKGKNFLIKAHDVLERKPEISEVTTAAMVDTAVVLLRCAGELSPSFAAQNPRRAPRS